MCLWGTIITLVCICCLPIISWFTHENLTFGAYNAIFGPETENTGPGAKNAADLNSQKELERQEIDYQRIQKMINDATKKPDGGETAVPPAELASLRKYVAQAGSDAITSEIKEHKTYKDKKELHFDPDLL